MKRMLVLILLLATLSVFPVLAQPASNPAAFLPGDVAAYFELRADDVGMGALNDLAGLVFGMMGAPGAQGDVIDLVATPALTSLFPGVDVWLDVLPWLGDRIGVGILSAPGAEQSPIFVLPVRDADAAAAFVDKFLSGKETQSFGGVTVYKTATVGLVVGIGVMWLSSPAGIDLFLASPMLERLTDSADFQKVRATLPADAALNGYVSGAFLLDTLAQAEAAIPEGQPTYGMMLEAALRLHPAESVAEAGLLAAKSIDGIGFALQVTGERVDLTTTLSIDAQYPAPTLTTATAGTALLNLIPNDSFVTFASYDVSLTAVPVVGLALLGPAIGNIFDNIVAGLGPTDVTPTPSPTPTPTPTPIPVTVDTLIAQAQPAIQQIESFMGMSLDQLYALTNGEYAVAVFPGPGPTLGAAIYLQSSDPQKLIDTIDHVSKLFLTDPITGAQVVTVQHQTMDGIDVALLGEAGLSDRPALGIINGNVLFLTLESSVTKVIGAAQAGAATTPALAWLNEFGDGQEALFYLDPRTLDLYALRQPRNPPLPLTAVAGSLDARDDGLFVLRIALATT